MARLTDADKAIIAQFPDATPHDLLTKHGLSEKGFNSLVASKKNATTNGLKANEKVQAKADTNTVPEPPKKPLTPTVKHILQPVTDQPMPTVRTNRKNKVRLVPINSGSGSNGTMMDRGRAEKMVRMYPKKYTISRK